MICEYLDVLYSLHLKDNKKLKIIIDNKNNINNCKIEFINEYYQAISDYQKNKIYFIDFTKIIEILGDIYYTNIFYLEKILKIFNYDLSQKCNYELRKNLTLKYYNVAIILIDRGQLRNENLLKFISSCDIYKSSKTKSIFFDDDFVYQYNNLFLQKKNINILNNLDINSEKNIIFHKMNQMEIYKYFMPDMGKEYIEHFTQRISNIKYLGIFFIILPKKFFVPEAVDVLFNWIKKYLKTYIFVLFLTFFFINIYMIIIFGIFFYLKKN
jgi:Pyruvate/2-oxoacid:ferredoxin oxidoreductase gamma subunit